MAGVSGGLDQNYTGTMVQLAPGNPVNILIPAASFSRPADTTAYASGDLVANSTTAGSVTPLSLAVTSINGGTGILRRCTLRKSGTSTTNAQFRVHFYNTTGAITCANGDNGAWSTNGVASYLGAMDVTIDKAFTDGASGQGIPQTGTEISFLASNLSTNIQALLEARAAYTPASAEVFTLSLEDLQ